MGSDSNVLNVHPEHNRCYDLMQALRADLPALLAIQETLVAQ